MFYFNLPQHTEIWYKLYKAKSKKVLIAKPTGNLSVAISGVIPHPKNRAGSNRETK